MMPVNELVAHLVHETFHRKFPRCFCGSIYTIHSVGPTPPTRSDEWPALLAARPRRFIVAGIAIHHGKKHKQRSTYRAPAVVAVWASLRAADPLIMVAFICFDSKSTEYQKSDGRRGEVPAEAVEGQSAAGTRKTSGAETADQCRP